MRRPRRSRDPSTTTAIMPPPPRHRVAIGEAHAGRSSDPSVPSEGVAPEPDQCAQMVSHGAGGVVWRAAARRANQPSCWRRWPGRRRPVSDIGSHETASSLMRGSSNAGSSRGLVTSRISPTGVSSATTCSFACAQPWASVTEACLPHACARARASARRWRVGRVISGDNCAHAPPDRPGGLNWVGRLNEPQYDRTSAVSRGGRAALVQT